ncbi:RISC-loading complex subunit tarbp2-like [Bacillus rossius redtenbacheri]|uniref:RISC-loading complex subunit tarbp2-like n=1 Tax=Bacillus rossius redtenbacheri TaxID=93214 RepID=UPI002FDD115B
MSKTPVSMLQEHFMRQGSMPLYKLIFDQGGTHKNLFKYQVSVGELSAVGSGSSKKEAKHDAARTLLERLHISMEATYHPAKKVIREVREDNNAASLNESFTSEGEDIAEFTSPAMNSIGKLNDALRSKSLPQAEFSETGEEGPPHEKLFTITCTVSKQKESATARTKKLAKHLAAEKMLVRLLKTIPDVLTPKPKPPAQESTPYEHPLTDMATAVYCDLKGTKKPSTNPAMINGYHLAFIGQHSETLNKLVDDVKYIETSSTEKLVQKFEKIMAELDMTYTFENNPFIRQLIPMEGKIFIALRMRGSHEDTVIGFGLTENEAKRNALHQAFDFLRTMVVVTI